MSSETSEVVERMYQVLLEEIRSNRPELLGESFTVAEIYQDLMPYRTHRDRIGIEMNGDYEHALLRLLAGEGEYVELESDAARDRFREELDGLHPDTGVYRNFAACEVRLSDASHVGGKRMDAGPRGSDDGEGTESVGAAETSSNGSGRTWAGEGEPRPTSADADEGGAAGPEASGEEAAEGGAAAPALERIAAEEEDEGPREEADPDGTCHWCRERLPERDDLRFCPFCGSRVDRVPCPECGTELEEGWLFCVACGTGVQD